MAVPPASKSAPSLHHKEEARRRFLRSVFGAGALLGISALGYLPVARAGSARLRPPGALEEDDFLASCIKCGQCVQVCPVEALKLADIGDGYGIGTPHIAPREQACDFSCDAAQCILACPTGALTYRKPAHLAIRDTMRMSSPPILLAKEKDPEPTLNLAERMGVARLARPDLCLARQGKGHKGAARETGFPGLLRFMDVDRWRPVPLNDHPFEVEICDLCVRTCPIKGAISLEPLPGGFRTPVVHEACVGCGVCEMACPTEPAAIVIDARAGWRA
jgi:ferredoxin-type protein NapG